MQNTDTINKQIETVKTFLAASIQIIFGSLFLALMAQCSFYFPFTPVPITLQTLGVSLLAITLGKKKAPLAVIAYLIEASMGAPVLANGLSNPFWMFGLRAGYLFGFVFSAFLVGYLLEKNRKNLLFSILSISVGEVVTFLFGTLWLSFYVGKEQALALGLFPFIPGTICKIVMAVSASALLPKFSIKNRKLI